MSHQYDGPPTVAELTGLEDLATAAADQIYEEELLAAETRQRTADARLRANLIAQGRIKPASKQEATRAMLIAKGVILPADPREVAEVYRAKFTGATFAPTGDVDADWPWFGRSTTTGFPTDEYGYER